MRAIDLVAIISGLIAAAPTSAAAATFNFTYTFNNPSPLLGYINQDGSSFDQINPAAATLNSITLHAAANATWSGGAGTDFNEATYTITLGGFHFSMTAEKQGNGSAGAFIDFIDTTPADLSDFIGSGLVPTSVSVSDAGGTAAFISSTFETESVTYNFTLISSGVPGVPIFPASPRLTLSVPESSTWTMMLVGLVGLGFAGYRQTRKGQIAGRLNSALARLKRLITRLALVVDARRPRLLAAGQGREQFGQLGVAVRLDEPRYSVSTAPGARLAHDRQCRGANIR